MRACKHCLMAIEAHEGRQYARQISWEDITEWVNEEDETIICEWCDEETYIDDMVEI